MHDCIPLILPGIRVANVMIALCIQSSSTIRDWDTGFGPGVRADKAQIKAFSAL